MILLGLAADEPGLTSDERRWRREARSGWLRLSVLGILIVNLWVGEHGGNLLVHAHVIVGYATATALALGLALAKRGPLWTGTAFVVADAAVVVALFHEHLYGSSGILDHNLTTTSLAIAFLLLNHVALRLRPHLVVVFVVLVLVGWLLLLALVVLQSRADGLSAMTAASVFVTDAALAATFAFAAFVVFLLIRDHNVLVKSAMKSEQRRNSLSRFFSPGIVAELQKGTASLDLERREAAVVFVDLRSFTRFTEIATPGELAELLEGFRRQVVQAVFEWDGTVDKFIGDGVMAVFGHPRLRPDDAQRALSCVLRINELLSGWKEQRRREGKVTLDWGIGLHVGPVIGGVLRSGYHDEFTVFGDAVNVAERLERLAKALDAAIVVSADVLAKVPSSRDRIPWRWSDGIELDGRRGRIGIAYWPRADAARAAA